jgi:hypothetical protein
MWILLVRAALTGIFGSAFGKWFLSTRMGMWFQKKLDAFMEYLAVKYDIQIAKKETKWRSDYPLLAERIDKLEEWAHPPIAPGGTTELLAEMDKLQAQINELKSRKPATKRKQK